MFFATISAEILRIGRATSSVAQFVKGADPLGLKKVLAKMINRHALQFEKYNTNNGI